MEIIGVSANAVVGKSIGSAAAICDEHTRVAAGRGNGAESCASSGNANAKGKDMKTWLWPLALLGVGAGTIFCTWKKDKISEFLTDHVWQSSEAAQENQTRNLLEAYKKKHKQHSKLYEFVTRNGELSCAVGSVIKISPFPVYTVYASKVLHHTIQGDGALEYLSQTQEGRADSDGRFSKSIFFHAKKPGVSKISISLLGVDEGGVGQNLFATYEIKVNAP